MLPSVPSKAKKAEFEKNLPEYTKLLNEAMKEFGINTPLQQAAFIATLGEESIALTTTVEGKTRYKSDPNGWYGRGYIQLTHKENYADASKALKFGDPPDYDLLVKDREQATDPKIAFRTAAWFWTQKHATSKDGKKTYPTASECIGDKTQPDPTIDDFKNASYAVNGWKKEKNGKRPDPNGWKDRMIYYKRTLKEVGLGDDNFYNNLDAKITSAGQRRAKRGVRRKK